MRMCPRVIHKINKYCISVPLSVIGYAGLIAVLYVTIVKRSHDDYKEHYKANGM